MGGTCCGNTAPQDNASTQKRDESGNDDEDNDLKIESLADLSKNYNQDTIECTKLVGAIFASDPKRWRKKPDGMPYTSDEFDTIVHKNKSMVNAIDTFEKIKNDDQIRLLTAFFRERMDQLKGDQKFLSKINKTEMENENENDDDDNKTTERIIDESSVDAELRPFIMCTNECAIPFIREKKEESDSKQDNEEFINNKKNNDEIIDYVENKLREAIDKKVTAKASGADRAFTSIVDPKTRDGIEIAMAKYGNPKCDIDKSVLTKDAQTRVDSNLLGLIEAGAFAEKIQRAYWPDYDKNKPNMDGTTCLPNRGSYGNLSVVGLAQVGAMGYSNGNPNTPANSSNQGLQQIIESIRAMTVEKDENGKLIIKQYQIEKKSKPIHDYNEFKSKNGENIELIQNDDVFNNWVTSFGVYGVITHAYITLVPSHILVETRKGVRFSKWESKFDEFCKNDNIDFCQFWISPYNIHEKTDICLACTWSRAPDGETPNTQKYIKDNGGVIRNVTRVALWIVEKALLAMANLGSYGGVSIALQCGLKETRIKADKIKISCVQAFDFGLANETKTITFGAGISMDRGNEFVKEVINDYIDFLKEKAKKNKYFVTSPFAVRFGKKSNGHLAMTSDNNMVWIEQPLLEETHRGKRLLKQVWSEFWWKNNAKYQSKIHWGLYFPMTDELKQYAFANVNQENLESFKKNYAKYNSGKVFCNQFTQMSGLDDVFE